MNVYDMLKPDLIRAVLFTMISEVQLEGVISDVPGRKVEGRLTVKLTAKRIYKRWVLHIYVSLQEGFIRKVADKTWGIPAGTRVINHLSHF